MNITINIPDNILQQADQNAHLLHIKRSEYIRQALEHMNKQIIKNERYTRLQYLSKLVRDESMKTNEEFEAIEYEPEA
jgi:metal-responsive CopG/Arc/MetJ family transcriptional regulator